MDMNDKSNLEIAKEMYIHEHNRWSSWAIFYFSLIGGLILGHEKIDKIPLAVIFIAEAFISYLWLLTVLSIRKSSSCWFKTVMSIEENKELAPFHTFNDHFDDFSKWEDFCENFNLKNPFNSTTRVFVALSLFMILGFSALAIYSFL
jgi:hypothetical protein